MTNVRIGIQTGNFYQPNPSGSTTYQSISNNTIASRRVGLFHNLHYSGASPFTVDSNTFTTIDNPLESGWRGILLGSLQTIPSYITHNTINGAGSTRTTTEGINVWNCQVAPSIVGGTISNVKTGINVNNYEGFTSNANNTSASIDSISIVASEIGVNINDNALNTNNATVFAEIKGNTEISGALVAGVRVNGSDASVNVHDNLSTIKSNAIGILVDAGLATITNNTIKDNVIGLQFQNNGSGNVHYNNIVNNSSSGLTNSNTTGWIDATNNYWGNANGPSTVGFGSGDKVSSRVTYCPWLTNNVSTPSTGTSVYTINNDVIDVDVIIGSSSSNVESKTSSTTVSDMVCSGTVLEIKAPTMPASNTTSFSKLKIEVTDVDNVIGGSAITYSATANTYGLGPVTLTNISAANKSITIKLTPFTDTNTDGDLDADECYGEAVTVNVTVRPEPVLIAPALTSVCSEEIIDVAIPQDINAPLVTKFDISKNIPMGLTETGSPAVMGNAITYDADYIKNDTYENLTTGALIVTYKVIPYSADNCKGDTIDIKVEINPEPVIVSPAVVDICSEDIIGIEIPQALANPLVAKFDISKIVPSGLTSVGMLSTMGTGILFDKNYIKNDKYQNLTANTLQVKYTVVPYSANDCVGEPIGIKVNVKPAPNPIPTTTIHACSGSTYNFDFDTYIQNAGMDLGQVSYVYNVAKVPNIPLLDPDPSGTGFTSSNGAISNTITNYSSSPITVRYTVTPTGGNGCVGASFIVNVVINPLPQVNVNPNGSNELCENESRVILGQVFPSGSYTYKWKVVTDNSNSDPTVILPNNAVAPILFVSNDIATNGGNLVVRFIAMNNASTCVDSVNYTFVVNEKPEILLASGLPLTSCESPAGSSNGVFVLTSAVISATGTTTYHTSASDAQSGIGAIGNPGAYVGTDQQTIWVRSTSGACFEIKSFVLDVIPAPVFTFAITNAPCLGGNGTITIAATGIGLEYSKDNGASWQTSNTFSLPAGTYSLKVKNSNGCLSATQAATIIQPAQPLAIIITTTPPSCSGPGSSTISNYETGLTYTFDPTGPTVGVSGLINGAVIGQLYSVTASNGSCTSAPTSFVNLPTVDPGPSSVINCPSSNVILYPQGCDVSYYWIAPTYANNCTSTPLSVNLDGAADEGILSGIQFANFSFVPFNDSVYNITYTNPSSATPSAVLCAFTVTIRDTISPILVCPTNITVSVNPATCMQNVNYLQPTASDNCSIAAVVINNTNYLPGSNFPLGTSNVVWTATDQSGNTTSCSFNVVVNGTCNGSADLSTSIFVPALSLFNTGQNRDYIVNMSNVTSNPTSGTIQFFIPFSSGYTFSFNGSQTSANTLFGPQAVNNADWTLVPLSTGILFSSKVGVVIPGNGVNKIAINVLSTSGLNSGVLNPIIVPGSGGDNNAANNSASFGFSTN